MSIRLSTGGRLIDRTQTLSFTFNGVRYQGYQGDTLASALLANGQTLLGRSFKYHRPRGVVTSGAEEPNALMNLGTGARFEPNQRATTTRLFAGLEARSQNHWPSLKYDVGALNSALSPLFSAGFYYKTFIHPRPFWKHIFEPVIRQSAGLGAAPTQGDPDTYEHYYATVDVLVVGGGVAGLAAAREAVAAGARVLVLEQGEAWGGRALVDGGDIDGHAPDLWAAQTVAELAQEGAQMRLRTMAAGVYDHGYVLAYERIADHTPGDGRPRHRLWRIRAGQVVTATGAIERPLSFAGNDTPGVMLASAVRDYLSLYGVACGERTVVVTNNDDGYRTALALVEAGCEVPAVLDARPDHDSDLVQQARAAGLRLLFDTGVKKVEGGAHIQRVIAAPMSGNGPSETIACDCLAMSGGWSPVVHLWSHCGGKLLWDDARAMFKPDLTRPPLGAQGQGFVVPGGAASGALLAHEALEDGANAGRDAVRALGLSPASTPLAQVNAQTDETPLRPVWIMPNGADYALRSKAFLDFQNDVKVSDVQLAAQEGFESVEHTKRYTTLGMATDQGKLSNINGLAILADALGKPIPQVGTTTFRPPYTPISMGAIAGEARDELFKPTRKTPMDAWHDDNGAQWEPVSDWRRPYTYTRSGESMDQAVTREILNTRQNVGLLDASTLGKILVKGPDAGAFLDLIYTNMMSTLRPGRCRYGLMCTENGFLFDDGVVVRLNEDTYLCHTTSGGSDRVHAWMEEWLQTEWWDMKVYVANVTEQYARVAVVGPQARTVLERLGGMDVSREALPFMAFSDGTLGNIPARVHRISFSGELSYEIAIPASQGLAFWQACLRAGEDLGIQPYGTEALHVMRAEKGFIMIGDETDGTVIPQDLGLSWAISKKKDDFIGKRAMERSHLASPDRQQLVGLLTENPKTVLPDGAHAVEGGKLPGDAPRPIGFVTSTYFSPTLGRSIAMALVERGSRRMGETLAFNTAKDVWVRAKIVDPVFFDKEGARQNV
ncbi:MAG: sarcosine oxidase subunit alpha family protein [Pseudomonadota bacterium]